MKIEDLTNPINYARVMQEAKAHNPFLNDQNALAHYISFQTNVKEFASDINRRVEANLKLNKALDLIFVFTYRRN